MLKRSLQVLVLLAAVHVTVVGCQSLPSPEVQQAVYEEAVSLVQAMEAQVQTLEAKPNRTPQEAAQLAQARAVLDQVKDAMAGMADEEGQFQADSALMTMTQFIPPPWNVPVSLLVGGVGMWFKDRKNRNSFKSLVDAINKAKAANSGFAEALTAVGPQLKSEMGPTASAVVDKVRKTGKLAVI